MAFGTGTLYALASGLGRVDPRCFFCGGKLQVSRTVRFLVCFGGNCGLHDCMAPAVCGMLAFGVRPVESRGTFLIVVASVVLFMNVGQHGMLFIVGQMDTSLPWLTLSLSLRNM